MNRHAAAVAGFHLSLPGPPATTLSASQIEMELYAPSL